jgi:hypothetical protein
VVRLGLAGERRLALQRLVGVVRTDRRLSLAGVLDDVDHHGRRGGPLRDAVLRDVISAAAGSEHAWSGCARCAPGVARSRLVAVGAAAFAGLDGFA